MKWPLLNPLMTLLLVPHLVLPMSFANATPPKGTQTESKKDSFFPAWLMASPKKEVAAKPEVTLTRRTTSGMDSEEEMRKANEALTVDSGKIVREAKDFMDSIDVGRIETMIQIKLKEIYDLWDPVFGLEGVTEKVVASLSPKTLEVLGPENSVLFTKYWLTIFVTAHQGFSEAARSQMEATFTQMVLSLNRKAKRVGSEALDDALADLTSAVFSEVSRALPKGQTISRDRLDHQLRLFVSQLNSGELLEQPTGVIIESSVAHSLMSYVTGFLVVGSALGFFLGAVGTVNEMQVSESMKLAAFFAMFVPEVILSVVGVGGFGVYLARAMGRRSLKFTHFEKLKAACEKHLVDL